MAATFLWAPGTSNNGLRAAAFSVLTTELNALTNTSYVGSSVGGASGVFSNVDTAQAVWGELFFTIGTIGAMATGANVAGWFLKSYDGTTFETPAASTAPSRAPDFIVPLPGTSLTGPLIYSASGLVLLPALKFKVGLQNNTGQTLAATANVLRVAPVGMQAV